MRLKIEKPAGSVLCVKPVQKLKAFVINSKSQIRLQLMFLKYKLCKRVNIGVMKNFMIITNK